jgi:cytosine/uracil/thiamine/allantoin permease
MGRSSSDALFIMRVSNKLYISQLLCHIPVIPFPSASSDSLGARGSNLMALRRVLTLCGLMGHSSWCRPLWRAD